METNFLRSEDRMSMRLSFELMNKVMCLGDRKESCHVPSPGKFVFCVGERDDDAVIKEKMKSFKWFGKAIRFKNKQNVLIFS